MSFNHSLTDKQLVLSSVLLCAISSALVYVWRKRYNKRNYVKVAKVCKLVVYPVKSMPGIEVNHFNVTNTGIKYGPFHDRSWMVVDREGREITLRTEHKLALLTLSFHGQELWIDGKNMPTLKLKVKNEIQTNDTIIHTKIMVDKIDGIYCGKEAEDWISFYLGIQGAKIIQYVPKMPLRPSKVYKDHSIVRSERFPIIYQDAVGLYLCVESAIDDVNRRLPDGLTVNHRNFRASVVVTDCQPFAEDNWKYMSIGDIEFTYLKPCDRCAKTFIISDEGVVNVDEPVNTLRRYRSPDAKNKTAFGTKPMFGAMFGPEGEGQIRCGDIVCAVNEAPGWSMLDPE